MSDARKFAMCSFLDITHISDKVSRSAQQLIHNINSVYRVQYSNINVNKLYLAKSERHDLARTAFVVSGENTSKPFISYM